MTLPPGARVIARVGGGDINEAFHVVLAGGGEAFVKSRADTGPGEYAAEAAGLEWLAQRGAVRTPRVLEVHERYLALEWIASSGDGAPARSARLDADGAEELGRGLAAMHAAGASCFGLTAAAHAGEPARFGSLRLSNEPAEDWPSFYAERRLRPLARIARDRGVLPAPALDAVERVCERMGELAGPPEPPARLHGDLWSGNVMAGADGRAWLIDPSAYGGHREVDLAMLRLFGAPSVSSPASSSDGKGDGERVFSAYEEIAPLAEGWHERVELSQLLPLLVHAVLFGGSYVAAVERVARRYAGRS